MQVIITDIETTGRRTYNSKIVEAAAVVLDDKFTEIDRWSSRVNPGAQALALAQKKAMEVNKLTEKDLEDAPTPEVAAAAFQAILEKYPKATVHSFNNDFDSWFLAQAPWNVSRQRWGECIMLEAMEYMAADGVLEERYNGQPKFPRLAEALVYFGIKAEATHQALGDARAAADVFIEIKKRRQSRPRDVDYMQEAKYLMGEGY